MAVNVLALMMTTSLGGFPLSDNTMPDGASGKQARDATLPALIIAEIVLKRRQFSLQLYYIISLLLHYICSEGWRSSFKRKARFLRMFGLSSTTAWCLHSASVQEEVFFSSMCDRAIFYFGSSTTAHIEIFLTGSQGAANHSVDSAASQSKCASRSRRCKRLECKRHITLVSMHALLYTGNRDMI